METQDTSAGPARHGGTSRQKSCPRCGAEYEVGLQFCPRDGAALRHGAGGDDPVGQVIGDRYRILREIDSGGMGRVYLAQHLRMGRQCAVKIMRRALLDDESAQARFNREAESASRVSHPNVATIYDFGETSDGTAYLAMEYVPGESLTQLLEREGPLSPRRAAGIVGQIASGLDAAHELPIVHRDLKPDNVMVTRHRDGADTVKLVDFGIAKAAAGDGGTVTALGCVVGTPDYMAPEQAAGKAVDARADVYALGLVAYLLLTGTLAFTGETPTARMLVRLSEPPRTLAAGRPDVAWPPALQSVLDRALARDPAARYQSAGALGQDLSAAVADWQREPRRRPWRRRTVAALRGMVVVLPTRVLRGRAHAALVAGVVTGLLAITTAVVLGWIGHVPPDVPLTPTHPTAVSAAPDTHGHSPSNAAPNTVPNTVPNDSPDVSPDAISNGDVRGAGTLGGDVVDAPAGGGGGVVVPRAIAHDVERPTRRREAGPRPTAAAQLERIEHEVAALRAMPGADRARSAPASLAHIDRLLPALRSAHDSVAALYAAVEVHLSVGDAAAACTLLRQIRGPSRPTEFADGVDTLLAAIAPGCRPD